MSALPASLKPLGGNPEAVKTAATKLKTTGGNLENLSKKLGTEGSNIAQSLTGQRAAGFAEASSSAVMRVSSVASQVKMAGESLNGYAVAFSAAEEGIKSYAGKWEHQQGIIEKYTNSEDPAAAEKVRTARTLQGQHESEGETIRTELKQTGKRATTAFNKFSDAMVPGAHGMSPDEVLQKALGSWAKIIDNGKSPKDFFDYFKTAFDAKSAVSDAIATPARTGLLLEAVRQWKNVNAAELLAQQTRNLEMAKVAATVLTEGDDSYAALKAWMSMKEITSLKDAEAAAAAAAKTSNLAKLTEALSVTGKFAKGVAILGIASGVYDMVSPSHDGWRGWGDRGAGLLSAAGGTALLLNATPLLALGPVGGAVVVGALAIAAAWSIGNLVYDHWDDIKAATGKAVDWAGDKLSDLGEGAKNLVSDGWKAVSSLF